MAGGAVVGHRLHQPPVDVERALNQILPIAGGGAAPDDDSVAESAVNLAKLSEHDGDRVALVGSIVAVKQPAVGGNQDQFRRGGTGVDAQIGVPLIAVRIHRRRAVGVVAGQERIVVVLGNEEGLQGVGGVFLCGGVFDPLKQVVKIHRRAVRGIAGGSYRHKHVGVLRKHGVFRGEMERFDEPAAQPFEEKQRTAQKQDLTPYLPSLGQAGDGLVDHGLEDARRDILFARPLVQQRLDIAFREHAAAGRDSVKFLVSEAQPVELVRRDAEQSGHLVDKSAGAAGTGAVHPFFQAASQKDDLRVLAAQLHHHVDVGDEAFHRPGRGEYLLDEFQIGGLGDTEPRRTGDSDLHSLARQPRAQKPEHLRRFLPYLGHVTLIGVENRVVLVIEQHDFDCGAADIDSYMQ